MKTLVLLLSFLLQDPATRPPLHQIPAMKFDHRMISSGDNFPAVRLQDDSLDLLLVALGYGYGEDSIREHFGWTGPRLRAGIDVLTGNGYLEKSGDRYLPTISILTIAEAESLRSISAGVSAEIADSIAALVPRVREIYGLTSTASRFPYEEMSFFLLSDVLLDNWQIDNVESGFLGTERTARHGKRYFYQIAEMDTTTPVEAFGIYGNQYQCGDSICVVLYGNNRQSERRKFSELRDLPSPMFLREDLRLLDTLASVFEPVLLSILENSRGVFVREFRHSPYSGGMTFGEYFIWWYHLIYTDATDILAERGYLTVPGQGVFYYRFEQ